MILPVCQRPLSFDTKEGGFTITEILVVIMVGSLAIGFALSLFLFVARLVSGWQKETELKDKVHGVAYAIMQDMDRALRVEALDDSTWTIVLPADRRVTYRASAGAVYRDDTRLAHDPNIFIRLAVPPRSPRTELSVKDGPFTVFAEGTMGGKLERASVDVSLAKCSKLAFSSRVP